MDTTNYCAECERLTRERDEAREDAKTLREGWDREEKLRRDRDAAYQKRVEELEREMASSAALEERNKYAQAWKESCDRNVVLRQRVEELESRCRDFMKLADTPALTPPSSYFRCKPGCVVDGPHRVPIDCAVRRSDEI